MRPSRVTRPAQDVGLFADSGSACAPSTAGFGGFTVSG
jgi:hypothetical protein